MSESRPKTLSVPEAGWIYYGLRSAKASYQAAKRGEILTIKVGKLLRVPIVAMDAKLAEAWPQQAERVAERGERAAAA